MASVQELIAAAEAQKSPLIRMLEGAAGGYIQGQNVALEREKQRISIEMAKQQMEQQRQDQIRQEENRRNIEKSYAADMEKQRMQSLNSAGEKPESVFPQQKLTTVYERDSKGNLSSKKTLSPPDDEYSSEIKKANYDYKLQRISNVVDQQDERDYKRRERRNAERLRVVDKFNADPSVKKSQQTIDSASMISELVDSGNPIAAGSIPTFMARASGEVGNLSEADKKPFGGSRAILAKLEAALVESSTGKLTADNARFISELSNIMKSRAQANMENLAKKRAIQYSGASDFLTEDDIVKTLIPDVKESNPKDNISNNIGIKILRVRPRQ